MADKERRAWRKDEHSVMKEDIEISRLKRHGASCSTPCKKCSILKMRLKSTNRAKRKQVWQAVKLK